MELRLNSNIEVFRYPRDVVVLVNSSRCTPLQLRGTASLLISRIETGCTRQDLYNDLAKLGLHQSDVIQTVEGFLVKIAGWGALQPCDVDATHSSGYSDIVFQNLSLLVQGAAGKVSFEPCVTSCLIAAAILSLMLTITATAFSRNLVLIPVKPSVTTMLLSFVGISTWVILHEFAHAVCYLCFGQKSIQVGLRLRKFRLPTLFVSAKYSFQLQASCAKACISAAGLYIDLVYIGTLCFFILNIHDDEIINPLRLLCVVICFGFYANLNPWRISDGSNVLAAFFGDLHLKKIFSWPSRKTKLTISWQCSYWLWRIIYLIGFIMILVSISRVLQHVVQAFSRR